MQAKINEYTNDTQRAEGAGSFQETKIGLIPEDWEVVRLGDIAQIKSGGNAPQGDKYFKNGKYPFVRVQHFDGTRDYIGKWDLINDLAVKDYGLKLFPKGAVVFPKSGASIRLEKRAMLPIDCYVVSHLAVLLPKDNLIDNKFLLYLLKTIKFTSQSAGTTLPYLNLSRVSDAKIPFPPLPEQQRIAKVLGIIQRAFEQQDKIIEAAKNLKKSMMQKLFTQGLGHTEFKETEIGQIPEGWEVVKLGDFYKKRILLLQNGFPCGNWNDKGIGVPQLRPFNVNDEGKIVLDVLKYIQTDKDIKKYLIREGDVIFNNTNSEELVGKTAYWEKSQSSDLVLSNHMTIIRILKKEHLNPSFLAYFLHKKWFDRFYIGLSRRHVNQASVSIERLKSIPVPFPALPEQQEIAYILSRVDKKIEVEEKRKATFNELFKTMLHKLMIGEIRLKDVEV
jgi:type I restriction enzyme S subunit